MAKKRLASGITFDASAQTVVHADFSDITLAGIQLIVNATDQIIIYNFADTAKGGTLATDTLTLDYDTTSMSDTDELMILVEDGVATQAVTGTITANLSATDNQVLDDILADTAAIEIATEATQAGLETVGGLVVNLGANNDVTVTGSVTADLGANNDVTVTSGTITAELSAVDNAVLDTIDAVLDTIKVDTEAIETAVEAIQAAQLPDGHNVTVDNASIAVTGTFWQATQPVSGSLTVDLGANNDVTVTGTVTANLSATDNQVLDDILADTAAIQTAVELIDNTIYTDDADFSDGVSVGQGVMAVAEGTPTTVTDGDMGMLSMSTSRHLKVVATASDALLTTIDADTGGILTAVQIMDDWDNGASDGASVSGDVASDTADAGEPVKIGFKAYELDGTAPQTAVAELDRVNAISDLIGRQYTATEHPRFWHASVDYASAQTNATVKAAAGAGLALYITDIMISNGATAGNVTLLDGSGGTVLFELYPAINGGVSLNLKNPIKLTDNTLLAITSTTVTTHSVFVSGFID